MRKLHTIAIVLLLTVLGGCGTYSGPYYYGGTGYRIQNIGGLPISGSLGVSITQHGLMVNPNLAIRPSYINWKK